MEILVHMEVLPSDVEGFIHFCISQGTERKEFQSSVDFKNIIFVVSDEIMDMFSIVIVRYEKMQ